MLERLSEQNCVFDHVMCWVEMTELQDDLMSKHPGLCRPLCVSSLRNKLGGFTTMPNSEIPPQIQWWVWHPLLSITSIVWVLSWWTFPRSCLAAFSLHSHLASIRMTKFLQSLKGLQCLFFSSVEDKKHLKTGSLDSIKEGNPYLCLVCLGDGFQETKQTVHPE